MLMAGVIVQRAGEQLLMAGVADGEFDGNDKVVFQFFQQNSKATQHANITF